MTNFELRLQRTANEELKLPPLSDLSLTFDRPRKIVITGAPWSGKTTTVKGLYVATGIRGVPEPAMAILHSAARRESLGTSAVRGGADGKELAFSQKVLEKRMQLEAKLRPDRSYFFDRGLHDSIAYFELDGEDKACFNSLHTRGRYDLVFFLEPIPGIVAGGTRNEFDVRNQKTLAELIAKAYESYGYKIIRIPVMAIDERIKVIAQECRNRLC